MNNVPTILALDASSTSIGWVLYAGAVLEHGEHRLAGGDIACRCQTAYDILALLLDRFPEVDCVAYEAAVGRYFTACEAECNVQGAILTAAAQRNVPILKISPAAAKKALAGKGNASKGEMQEVAKQHGVYGEHASDSLGVAISTAKQVLVVV